MRFRLFLFAASMAFGGAWSFAEDGSTAARPSSPQVKLAVVIAVDQLRGDYLTRFRPYFGGGGFKRLLEHGADFRNCHYRHALTQTAPGHATILTGAHPETHGIISNDWLDLQRWEIVNNVEDRDSLLVGVAPGAGSPALLAAKAGRSPRNLRATTVGDQLKMRFGANSKVISVSNKDRSAILLGGKLADGAYWDEAGQMITSRYYREKLPGWVAAFNAERRVEAVFGKTWERMLDPAVYDQVQGPDDAEGETTDFGFTRVFPKKIDGGANTLTGKFYAAYDQTPFSSEFLAEFARRAIREERLGHHAATDLLCVSFSQLDSIGHSYGPDSHEVMDSMLRLDRILAALLAFIDAEVGLKQCVVVLTSDHGAAPMPERLRALNPELAAGRIEFGGTDRDVRQALDAAFGRLPEGEYWFTRANNGYHLRPSALAARKVTLADAAKVVKAAVERTPFITAVFTRDEILAAKNEGDSLLAMLKRNFFAAQDRDVIFLTKPYYFARSTGTTHGTPYDYDTHVPLVWFGRGVPNMISDKRVSVNDLAPTLAKLLGLPPPPQAAGQPLL